MHRRLTKKSVVHAIAQGPIYVHRARCSHVVTTSLALLLYELAQKAAWLHVASLPVCMTVPAVC